MTNQCSIDKIKPYIFFNWSSIQLEKRKYESKMDLAFHVDFKTESMENRNILNGEQIYRR